MNKPGILLDTHVWIWFIQGNESLKRSARDRINQAIEEKELYISAISIWEISMLVKKGRLSLEMPCLEWIHQSLNFIDAEIIPLTPAITVDSCNLPGKFHQDPADQIIVASTRILNLALMTRDERILDYARKKHVKVIKV
jgi:PIN domain nuclease of toxin-antitoxin system